MLGNGDAAVDADRLSGDAPCRRTGEKQDHRGDIAWLGDAEMGSAGGLLEHAGAERVAGDEGAAGSVGDQRGSEDVDADTFAFCFHRSAFGEHHDRCHGGADQGLAGGRNLGGVGSHVDDRPAPPVTHPGENRVHHVQWRQDKAVEDRPYVLDRSLVEQPRRLTRAGRVHEDVDRAQPRSRLLFREDGGRWIGGIDGDELYAGARGSVAAEAARGGAAFGVTSEQHDPCAMLPELRRRLETNARGAAKDDDTALGNRLGDYERRFAELAGRRFSSSSIARSRSSSSSISRIRSRSWNFCILPLAVNGRASTISRRSGTLVTEMRRSTRRKVVRSSSVGAVPSATTKAQARSPRSLSGMATTAASLTLGWAMRCSSTSRALMLAPPRMMMSFSRPVTRRQPWSSMRPRSPERAHPCWSKASAVRCGSCQ